MNGTFTVRLDGEPGPTVRSALVPPRLTHQIVSDAESMVFCYFDPGSARHHACQREMATADGPVRYGHRHESALTAANGLTDVAAAHNWLNLAAKPRTIRTGGTHDGERNSAAARIGQVITILHELDPHDDASASRLATLVGLSISRFLRLFREHTGTSFRRYRLWVRMLRVAALIRDRAELTTAAMDAGFASPSHFSTTFHSMFGLPPNQLLRTEIHLATH